jgi:hypothetical protein
MNNIIFFLLLVMVIITSCEDTPITTEQQNTSINWDLVYSFTKPQTYTGGAYGNTFYIGILGIYDCNLIRIRAKYTSYYQQQTAPPYIWVDGTTSGFLRENKSYSTFDSIFYLKDYPNLRQVGIKLVNAKIRLDSVQVYLAR